MGLELLVVALIWKGAVLYATSPLPGCTTVTVAAGLGGAV